jgi:predicted ATPase
MEIDHGNVKQGLNQLQGAIDKFRLSDCKQHLTSFLTSLARGLLLANRQAEAAATIAEAIAICDRTGEGWCLPELHRWKGEIALAKGEPSDFTVAQMAFRHAMNLARQQGALAWELRAASSLARHSIETGQAKDAYSILRPVYERYTEGFDRPDLMEAADLLSRTSS